MRIATLLALSVSITGPVAAAELALQLGGDFYNGAPAFEVLIDGSSAFSGVVQDPSGETYNIEVPEGAESVTVRFLNDEAAPLRADGSRAPNTDRNLVVLGASFGDRDWTGTDFTGEKTNPRGSALVLYSNTEVSLALNGASEVEEDEASLSEAASRAATATACNLRVEVSGFGSGDAALTQSQKDVLQPLLEVEGCTVIVTGYSSTFGPSAVNERVSLDRAQTVMNYLQSSGMQFAGQEVMGAGETAEFGGRQADNRRVVVELEGSD